MTRASGLYAGLALLCAVVPAPAQQSARTDYEVSFPNALHHEARVALRLTGLPSAPLELRMSRSSPGRYSLHEFAKNVYDVVVTDESGVPLRVVRPDPHEWVVAEHGQEVRVSYTLFADRADGTYSQVDLTHAHLNMPASFMYARGLDEAPISVVFHPPAGSGWKVATQLVSTANPMAFEAPNLQYFMDSPTELSDFALREWTLEFGGTSTTMRLALHHQGTEADVDAFADELARIVREEVALVGVAPRFDHGTYTFIVDYLPYASRDGMEHRNSTIVTRQSSAQGVSDDARGTAAHEFFHAWNVERMRPAAIEPFDFERTNMSGELWFAEGFTSYFGPLTLVRAGLVSLDDYAAGLGQGIDATVHAPGRRFFSPVEMSMQAPFADRASSADPLNQANTFLSYYTWGSALGLALDLTLRSRFALDLDGFMRRMWSTYGEPEVPYTVSDIEVELGAFTGDPAFAGEFFERFVRGREVPDFASLLAHAGLLLRPARPGAVTLGPEQFDYEDSGAVLKAGTIFGSPLYAAGLEAGDRILALGGRFAASAETIAQLLDAHSPGDELELEVETRTGRHTVVVRLAEDPTLELVTYKAAGRDLTDEMREFRIHWLSSRVN